jgi:hypothetical protein
MQTDRMAVLDWLWRAEEGLLAAAHAVESAEGELGPASGRFGDLAARVEDFRSGLDEARRALRGLATQVRVAVPAADDRAA